MLRFKVKTNYKHKNPKQKKTKKQNATTYRQQNLNKNSNKKQNTKKDNEFTLQYKIENKKQ